jgi:hypothetical protein
MATQLAPPPSRKSLAFHTLDPLMASIMCYGSGAMLASRYLPGGSRRGDSKANFRQGVSFLQHLWTLAWECSPALAGPRLLLNTSPRKSANTTASPGAV